MKIDFIIPYLWIIFGVIFQAFLLIKNNLTWRKALEFACIVIFPAILVGLIGFGWYYETANRLGNLFTKYNQTYAFVGIFYYIIFFSLIFALRFKKEILPFINNIIVLFYNSIVAYLLVYFALWETMEQFNFLHIILYALAIPTIITFIIIFLNIQLNIFFKLFFYGWFIIMVLTIGFYQYLFGYAFTIHSTGIASLGAYRLVLFGMLIFYLLAHVEYFILLFPIRAGEDTFRGQLQHAKEYYNFLIEKHKDGMMKRIYLFYIIIGLAIIFAINDTLKIFPKDVFIGTLFITVPQIIREVALKRRLKVADDPFNKKNDLYS